MRVARVTFITLALLAGGALPAGAEVLTVPPGEESAQATIPQRGMSMTEVQRLFGEPQQKVAPVGEPPIARWVYGEYTVYFEHQYVIHTVRSR